jgi:long-chain acyl-CoA synthetase
MGFDTDLHRHTIRLPGRLPDGRPLEMSVVEAGPQGVEPQEAPVMVFIHGFAGRAAYWEYQLEQFQNDYRVIALDLRGHGYTDAPTAEDGARYDVPELVADIEAALNVLQVPQRFVLICHSFGGALSSYFIKKHPQRVSALVIIASAAYFKLRLTGRLLLRVPPALLLLVRKVLPYVGFNMARVYPPAHVVYLQNKHALSTWNGSEYLSAIKVPTMVILGQRDILFSEASYQEVARLVPDAEQVVIPGSAHQVMVERPDAVNRAIERFLQAQIDPSELAELKSQQKARRRAARKALELERPWLKFYDARTPYRIKLPSVALPRLLETTARRFGKTPALHYLGASMNWAEVEKLANRFARGLITLGVKPRQSVLLALPNIPQWIIAHYGILKAGGIVVLADGSADCQDLLTHAAETSATVLIASAERYPELQGLAVSGTNPLRHVVLASSADYVGRKERLKALLRGGRRDPLSWSRSPDENGWRFTKFSHVLARGYNLVPEIEIAPDDIAVIAYTHGSTGQPLAVPLTHRNLAANALQLRHWLPEARPGDERFLAQQPFSTAYGLTGLLHLAVYLGATMILLPSGEVEPLLKIVKKMRPTYFPTTPRMIRQLTHTPGVRRFGLATIRVCAVSGSSLPQEVREEFEKITRGRLIEAYGLTEASPAVLAMPLAARRRATGLPLPDTEAKIIDLDTGLPAAVDEQGELWVRGPQVFAGYLHTENAASDGVVAQRLQDGWLATGDIASADEDGFITVIDRKKNMLIRMGRRVFPRQLEEALFEHPAIASAHASAHTDDQGSTRLIAEVLLHRNMSVTIEELLKYCSKRLHPAVLPDSITIQRELATPA